MPSIRSKASFARRELGSMRNASASRFWPSASLPPVTAQTARTATASSDCPFLSSPLATRDAAARAWGGPLVIDAIIIAGPGPAQVLSRSRRRSDLRRTMDTPPAPGHICNSDSPDTFHHLFPQRTMGLAPSLRSLGLARPEEDC